MPIKKMLQHKTQKVLKENLAKSPSIQKGRSYLTFILDLSLCIFCKWVLKGHCHEIFVSGFFLESVSLQCFENSRRYSQVKAHHRDTGGKFATGGIFCHKFC
jgi:hypothetical protein